MKLPSRIAAALAGCLAFAAQAQAQVPAGYPADYTATIAAARQEGKVRIFGATDTAAASPLIKDFEALYPGV
jgi:iron(III) transport system substrate-binding protein